MLVLHGIWQWHWFSRINKLVVVVLYLLYLLLVNKLVYFYFSTRFFGSNVKVVPIHSNGDAVRSMLTIAKVSLTICDPVFSPKSLDFRAK